MSVRTALPLPLICFLICLVLPCTTGPAAWSADQSASPRPGAALTIEDAIDGIIDEDEPTRKRAFARLDQATAEDLPALETALQTSDPEIRNHAALIVKRLKRGEVVFHLAFPGDTPAAQVKVSVNVYPGEGQVYTSGGRSMAMPKVIQGTQVTPVFSGECTSDADGRISAGRFNDGTYVFVLLTEDPLPVQRLSGNLELTRYTPVVPLDLKRGVTVQVQVVDDQNAPLNGVQVCNIEDGNFIKQFARLPRPQLQAVLRQYVAATTDEKGAATLEKTGLSEINLFALKSGYDPAFQENIKAEDGSTIAVKITLNHSKPVHLTLTGRDAKNQPFAGARILVVHELDALKVCGAQGTLADPAKLADYIKLGAVDLGTLDDTGVLRAEIVPDIYRVFAIPKSGEDILCNSLDLSGSDKEPKRNLRFVLGRDPVDP